jgi:RNA polymerase sigma factor (sigma-70 family)
MSEFAEADLLALIDRARAHDAAALNELMTRVRRRMKGFLRVRVGDVESSDLAQDTLVKLVDHLEGFQGTTENQFWKWAHVVARNVAAQSLRFASAKKRGGAADPLPEDSRGGVRIPDSDPSPSAIAQRREQLAEAAAARAHLTAAEQLVIRLRDDEDKDWPEVARLMDKTEEAARKFYRRAIKKWSALCADGS